MSKTKSSRILNRADHRSSTSGSSSGYRNRVSSVLAGLAHRLAPELVLLVDLLDTTRAVRPLLREPLLQRSGLQTERPATGLRWSAVLRPFGHRCEWHRPASDRGQSPHQVPPALGRRILYQVVDHRRLVVDGPAATVSRYPLPATQNTSPRRTRTIRPDSARSSEKLVRTPKGSTGRDSFRRCGASVTGVRGNCQMVVRGTAALRLIAAGTACSRDPVYVYYLFHGGTRGRYSGPW
jgi:hypothetical protein